MDVFQTSPGGAASNLPPTTTGTQPVPATQGQYFGHDVTSHPGSLSTQGMAPVGSHASAMVFPSTSQSLPARVSALSEASGISTRQQGISVTVNDTHVVVKNGSGETLYSVAKGDSNNKPRICMRNLAALAICQHAGKEASIEQIVSWVKKNIPYHKANKHLRGSIRSAMDLSRENFEAKKTVCSVGSKKVGPWKVKVEKKVERWKLKNEKEYFENSGLNKPSSVCPGSLPAPGISPVSSDTSEMASSASRQHYPATTSALGTASGSGVSAMQQVISIEIGNSDILIKNADGTTLHSVTKGSADTMPSTFKVCLIAMAICYHGNKATIEQITSWLKTHIPYYEKRPRSDLAILVSNEISFYKNNKNIFQKIPYSADQKKPCFWQLVDEKAYFQGTGTNPPTFRNIKKRSASATSKRQPPAAKKSRSQPESERSAGALSISNALIGDHRQLPQYPFAEGSLTASHQPASTGPIPPVSHQFSQEYRVLRGQSVLPVSFHPGSATPASFPPEYPGGRYQPAGPGAYPEPPPPYPFSGGHPVSYPQSFPGTVDPVPSAAFGDFPYGPEPASLTGSALPPYYPPVVVTTTNS